MRRTLSRAAPRRKHPGGLPQQQKQSEGTTTRVSLGKCLGVLLALCAVGQHWSRSPMIAESRFEETHGVASPTPSPTTPCPVRQDFHAPIFNATSGKGGLVLFFHIPKTGGTSIRGEFERLARSDPKSYAMMSFDERSHKSKDSIRAIDGYLENLNNNNNNNNPTTTTTTPIQLVEFHGIHPPFSKLYDKIAEWRRIAASQQLPFFVFSVVRDPFTTVLSTFNFFCFELRRYTKCPAEARPDHLMKIAKPDPQTRWLCKTSETFESNFTIPEDIDPKDIRSDGSYYPLTGYEACGPDLHTLLAAQMDWMGRLEEFGETIEVLQSLGIPIQPQKKNPTKRQHVRLQRSDLSEADIRAVQNGLELDSGLCEFSERCFRRTTAPPN